MRSLQILLFLLFCTISIEAKTSLSQNISCDSIEKIVDYLFVETTIDDIEVRDLSNQVYTLASEKNCDCLPKVLNLEGFQYYSTSDLLKAKELLLKAESMLRQKKASGAVLAKNQLFLGLVYVLEHNPQSSIQYFLNSREIYDSIGDEIGLADACQNLGMAYRELNDYGNAKEYLTIAYEKGRLLNKLDIQGYALQNLTKLYHKKGNNKKALEYAALAENTWEQLEYEKGLYYINVIYSDIYKSQGNVDAQIKRLHKSLDYSKSIGININKHIAYLGLGDVYYKINNFKQARIFFEKALANSKFFTEKEFNTIVVCLSDIYEQEKDFNAIKKLLNSTVEYNRILLEGRHIEANKWISSENSLASVKDQNQQLFATQQQSQSKLKAQQIWLAVSIGLFILCFIIAYYLYKQSIVRAGLLDRIKKQNQSLFEMNKVLESSAETIKEQNIKLENKNSELKNFAAVASHDLKSPARTIINFTGLMKRKVAKGAQPEEFLPLVETIERTGRNMYALIVDLLEYARLEKAPLNLAHFDPKDLVEDLLLDLQSTIIEKRANIELLAMPTDIIGDSIKVKQVFLNLINNGIKFAKAEAAPQIQISCEEQDTHYLFQIKDNGIGIDPAYQEKIFSMFQRLNSIEQYEGTGIGLATCQKVVELHDGKIWVDSTPEVGSTFYFTISKKLKLTAENKQLAYS